MRLLAIAPLQASLLLCLLLELMPKEADAQDIVRPRLSQLGWTNVLIGDPKLPEQFPGKILVAVAFGNPEGGRPGVPGAEEKRRRREWDRQVKTYAKDAMAIARKFERNPNVIVIGLMYTEFRMVPKFDPKAYAQELAFTLPVLQHTGTDIVEMAGGRDFAVFDLQGALVYDDSSKIEAEAAVVAALKKKSTL